MTKNLNIFKSVKILLFTILFAIILINNKVSCVCCLNPNRVCDGYCGKGSCNSFGCNCD